MHGQAVPPDPHPDGVLHDRTTSRPAPDAPGRYRYYKGGLYEVIATARQQTLELMTVYRARTVNRVQGVPGGDVC